ncbi:PREDICTED: zinc finger HIT domain-containing protein 3 [Vollenhovia emeryi]|uniref:zinc finger HIT domain-containing protein 3 n=1 Tax=Vollenhovia emeryi TaxID=411798 RepID=UPI0005F4E420|nr:PREDICTED: zinc finger HIT domain-containing protein 3 [Vollenhovia emeryi]
MSETVRKCCVCGKDGAAYKCPRCRELYCSVACCREHKTRPCEPPVLPERPKERQRIGEYKFPTEDTVPAEKLQKLCDSKELINCLQNPHLRHIMSAIMNSPNPTEAITLAMKEPIFVEMADACLKIVEPPDDAKPF